MADEKYDVAMRKWIAARDFKLDWTKISDVEFDMEWSGGCETCGYDYVTISYQYNGKTQDIGSIRYDNPAQMIQEMCEFL